MSDWDDFSSFSGPGADLNGDGRVDFTEYDNDCDDFRRIYGNHKSAAKGGGGTIAAVMFAGLFLLSMPPSVFSVLGAVGFFFLLKKAFE